VAFETVFKGFRSWKNILEFLNIDGFVEGKRCVPCLLLKLFLLRPGILTKLSKISSWPSRSNWFFTGVGIPFSDRWDNLFLFLSGDSTHNKQNQIKNTSWTQSHFLLQSARVEISLSRLQLISPWLIHVRAWVWGAVRKNIISDRFSTKTAISADI